MSSSYIYFTFIFLYYIYIYILKNRKVVQSTPSKQLNDDKRHLSINSIFLTFMVDMKNIESVFSRNTFQRGKKCRRFGIIFQSIIF